MRLVVAADSIGSLSSTQAGELLAAGWAQAETSVVPMGEAGAGFAQAMADQVKTEQALLSPPAEGWQGVATCVDAPEALVVTFEPARSEVVRGIDYHATSIDIGRAVRQALLCSRYSGTQGRRVIVDLSGARTHDAGAGLLAGLGAQADAPLDAGVAGLADVRQVSMRPALDLLAGSELVGVVPAPEATASLLGLRGITSIKGRAADEDAERLLATDATLEQFVTLVHPESATVAGAGACGGTGFAIAALGGRITIGARLTAELGQLAERARDSDLVVTGCGVLDFGARGGGVVAETARIAEGALRPCIAIAGSVVIGNRELRTMGIESAYSVTEFRREVLPNADVGAEEVLQTARRVARSWSW